MKSHVSMEQHQCIVCGRLYDTGGILLKKDLRATLEDHTVTGTGFCPEHQKLKDDGFIALIEADEKTHARTGRIAHIRATAWPVMFNVPVPGGMVAYVGKEVMDMLEKAAPPDVA